MQHSPGFLKLAEDALARVKEISPEAAAKRMHSPGHALIDVREDSEWNAGHANGAIHLGKGIIERDIEARIPAKGTTLLLYCGGGYRSALAADNLQKMGYTDVYSVRGGWKAWRAEGLPISTCPEVVPRSPYEKLAGLVFLPRLIDKCRLFPKGALPGYNYLTVGFDKAVLDFLCLDGAALEQGVHEAQPGDDEAVLGWLKSKLGQAFPSEHAIRDFNDRLTHRRPDTPERRRLFDEQRAQFPSTRRKVETYFDLIDLEEGRLDRLNS
jgi:rhodanese-related sulfurtransferase